MLLTSLLSYNIRGFVVWLALCLVGTRVKANSFGAPTCIGGQSAVGQVHRSEGYEETSIEAAGIIITVGNETLQEGQVLIVTVGETCQVTVEASQRPFKGLMTRIDGGENFVDASNIFELRDEEEDLKFNELCSFSVRVHQRTKHLL